MALGAIASTGAYTPTEVSAMAIPLLAGAFVELRRGSLYRFRRLLELLALAVFLFQVVARAGVLPTVVTTLFVLCGVRLCLPRALPQRRQLLLMGFLLFLTTALATSELDFLVWSLIWVAGTAAYLMALNWEKSTLLGQGPVPHPAPFRRVPVWTAAVAVLGAGFFLVLPRLHLGVRGLPLGIQGLTGIHAGLSDVVDLAGKGPIQGNSEVVMRIMPLSGRADLPRSFALLRGFVLEDLQGQRWAIDPSTPMRLNLTWSRPAAPDPNEGGPPALQNRASSPFRSPPARAWRGPDRESEPVTADCFVSPDPMSVIPTPSGRVVLVPPDGEQFRAGLGASVRWGFPVRRILPVRITARLQEPQVEPAPNLRRDVLTRTGQDTESALRWSLREAPGTLPAPELAGKLARALRSFTYSLDNPSGGAANPLQDFLERTHTGHCEFFASSLAIMLRHRGVAARVVNGYRLGPWIHEGGYYLVTQNEAHSWVEYYDPLLRGWRTEDPTPAAPRSSYDRGSLGAALARLADTIRFGWDRHVVRFSDEDQVAGLEWANVRLATWTARHRAALRGALTALGLLAVLGALAWCARAALPLLAPGVQGSPGRISGLRPLLRAAGRTAPPLDGETARAWLTRLGLLRTDRTASLATLAREADAVAYNGQGSTTLARLAREEARAWRRNSG